MRVLADNIGLGPGPFEELRRIVNRMVTVRFVFLNPDDYNESSSEFIRTLGAVFCSQDSRTALEMLESAGAEIMEPLENAVLGYDPTKNPQYYEYNRLIARRDQKIAQLESECSHTQQELRDVYSKNETLEKKAG